MEIQSVSNPPTSHFVKSYLTNNIDIDKYFDYNIHDSTVFQKRQVDLLVRSFPREALAEHLLSFNQRFQCHENTIENINRLKDPKSVVVIGGQQAGILTGPLYTIHKLISIIKLAQQQEKVLQTPVIPVFWIAGEDHDFAEINHLFTSEKYQIKKKSLPQREVFKRSVSDIEIDKKVCVKWIEDVFETFNETNYTNDILLNLKKKIDNPAINTYVDFFAAIIMELFKEYGIVLVDSGSKELRKIESEYLCKLVRESKNIRDALLFQHHTLQDDGFQKVIDTAEYSANLFFHFDNERVLLEYHPEENKFKGKGNECEFTMEELTEVALTTPEKLSNNVVTRPLMQEFLFPTLAFISGPGEIAYWAELKRVFGLFELKMPPVVPRLNITVLERDIEADMRELDVSLIEALKGTAQLRENWLRTKTENRFEEAVVKTQSEVEVLHSQLRMMALDVDHSLEPLLHKNAKLIQSQFEFLKATINKRVETQHQTELNKFLRIELSLYPNNSPQERIWNLFYYINKYGFSFVNDLMELPFEFNHDHKIIKV
ncbi:bacillithiol biosynthesis cysteine-adding enzyme BshC [Bacillus luteolus]|uniref:Putative cysteine ligase BshC n=1 Tax=Litchfieldia luteola TaxID=682179 RepID=A0ABR9QJZ8_9BACI|nr:bacillithiol biosynthesis cysteine-adding enzyme BshC [Cytobacillus luteolus]MBE4908830.1 bacillithiol biosynthesis cysteine-adding enzyme BshC [Cytobacillus luteolus]MBP1941688.1 bacillithiol biosynthesis cysteine-adding enzyme BshC [Cytobacillus luteolus]